MRCFVQSQQSSWPIRNVGMLFPTECNKRINLRAMVRSITLSYARAHKLDSRRTGTAIRKTRKRIMGRMFDNVGRLIVWLQKPADNCEPFTPNDSMAYVTPCDPVTFYWSRAK